MIPLWTGRAFLDALGGDSAGRMPDDITGISIDTRTLQQSDAFFAIRGERFDGHDFAPAAAENGAAVLVVAREHAYALKKNGVPLVVVDDVLAALEKLAAAARRRTRAKIIAITGSVGKTTIKEVMRHAFSAFGRLHASPASFNNHWGVPLTLARMPADTDFGIFEIGMNHENEIRPLVKLVAPDLVVVTRIAAAHLGHFVSLEEIADAKSKIFEGLRAGGAALLNADDAFFAYLAEKAHAAGVVHVASFGAADGADYRLLDVHLHADCSCFKVMLGGEEAPIKIGAPGRHMVHNALAVLGTAGILGVDIARVVLALQSFTPESGRGARYRLALPSSGAFLLIDESYNANPVSMGTGLALLGDCGTGQRGRRIAVLGDMLELGRFSRQAHEELAGPVRAAGVGLAFLGGHDMKYLADILRDDLQVHYCEKAGDLLPLVLNEVRAGDVVMVKSSNGIGLSRIVAALLDRYEPARS